METLRPSSLPRVISPLSGLLSHHFRRSKSLVEFLLGLRAVVLGPEGLPAQNLMGSAAGSY